MSGVSLQAVDEASARAIMLGTCERGDALVHFAHRDGGHFALEELARKAGIEVYHFPIVDRTLLVDVDRLHHLVRDHTNVRLVMLDQSFKLRWQPLLEIRSALPESVVLSYDCSHDGALIAGGVLPQPLLQGADILQWQHRHPRLSAVSKWLCPTPAEQLPRGADRAHGRRYNDRVIGPTMLL